MSATVTIPGYSGSIDLTFSTTYNLQLANQIAAALNAAATTLGALYVEDYTGGLTIPTVPSGSIEELVLRPSVSGSITVPAAASGVTEVLVLQNTQPITIHGSPNLSIIGGGANVTVIDPTDIVYADNGKTTNTDAVTVTAGDSPYFVAMRAGSETVVGDGSGTIAGGLGANFINVTGADSASNNLIFSQGFHDLVQTGVGNATVVATGSHATIEGSTGKLVVNDHGLLDSIFASNASSLAVTTAGEQTLVLGSSGPMTVDDSGQQNTISTGTAPTASITTGGSQALVFGNSSNLALTDSGLRDTISAGTGAFTLAASGADAFVWAGSASSFTGVDAGSYDTIVGGGPTTITLAGASGVFAAGSGATSVVATASSELIYGGSGPMSIDAAGSINLTVGGGSGAETVHAGSGLNIEVFGSAGGLDFIGGSGSGATVIGYAASNTVSGGDGGLLYAAGAPGSSATVTGTSSIGGVTLFGGANAAITYFELADGRDLCCLGGQ